MADLPATQGDVRLLSQHDLVDQTRGERVARWPPAQRWARVDGLQPLDQPHEVQCGPDVPAHECTQVIHVAHGGKDRVMLQALACGSQRLAQDLGLGAS